MGIMVARIGHEDAGQVRGGRARTADGLDDRGSGNPQMHNQQGVRQLVGGGRDGRERGTIPIPVNCELRTAIDGATVANANQDVIRGFRARGAIGVVG